MAIDIKDSFWEDPRFWALRRKLGEILAIGACVSLWKLAEQRIGRQKKLFDEDDLRLIEYSKELIEVGFLSEMDSGWYAKGSDVSFSWIEKRRSAASKGGLNSASRRRKINNIAQPNSKQTSSKTNFPSPSPSPFTSKEFNTSSKKQNPGSTSLSEVKTSPVNEVVGIYVKSFQSRYKARPVMDPKILGVAKRLARVPKICELIQVYLQMDDKWFLTKKHDLVTLEANLNKVAVALQTGSDGENRDTPIAELLRRGVVK